MQITIDEMKLWKTLESFRFFSEAVVLLDMLSNCGILVKEYIDPKIGVGYTVDYHPKCQRLAVQIDGMKKRVYFEYSGVNTGMLNNYKIYDFYSPYSKSKPNWRDES